MKQYLEVGRAVTTHGVRGELKIDVWCDSPTTFCAIKTLYLDGEGRRALKVLSVRPHKQMALVQIEGYDDLEQARTLVGRTLFAARESIQLEHGAHFICDLIGLSAVDADDETIIYGKVVDITPTGAHDLYHIQMENGKTGYVPAVKEMVVAVDLEAGVVRIRPAKGLFDDAN